MHGVASQGGEGLSARQRLAGLASTSPMAWPVVKNARVCVSDLNALDVPSSRASIDMVFRGCAINVRDSWGWTALYGHAGSLPGSDSSPTC